MNLYAELCRGRNDTCVDLIRQNEPIYSFDVVLKMMQNEEFPADLRAAFMRLMLTLYLDHSDVPEEGKIPLLVRPDCPFDCFTRGEPESRVTEENRQKQATLSLKITTNGRSNCRSSSLSSTSWSGAR